MMQGTTKSPENQQDSTNSQQGQEQVVDNPQGQGQAIANITTLLESGTLAEKLSNSDVQKEQGGEIAASEKTAEDLKTFLETQKQVIDTAGAKVKNTKMQSLQDGLRKFGNGIAIVLKFLGHLLTGGVFKANDMENLVEAVNLIANVTEKVAAGQATERDIKFANEEIEKLNEKMGKEKTAVDGVAYKYSELDAIEKAKKVIKEINGKIKKFENKIDKKSKVEEKPKFTYDDLKELVDSVGGGMIKDGTDSAALKTGQNVDVGTAQNILKEVKGSLQQKAFVAFSSYLNAYKEGKAITINGKEGEAITINGKEGEAITVNKDNILENNKAVQKYLDERNKEVDKIQSLSK